MVLRLVKINDHVHVVLCLATNLPIVMLNSRLAIEKLVFTVLQYKIKIQHFDVRYQDYQQSHFYSNILFCYQLFHYY